MSMVEEYTEKPGRLSIELLEEKSKDGLVKGNIPQERVNSWSNHYGPLLGTESSIDDPEEEIQAVFSNFEISDELFTASEYAKVKVSLKRGQSGGPDE